MKKAVTKLVTRGGINRFRIVCEDVTRVGSNKRAFGTLHHRDLNNIRFATFPSLRSRFGRFVSSASSTADDENDDANVDDASFESSLSPKLTALAESKRARHAEILASLHRSGGGDHRQSSSTSASRELSELAAVSSLCEKLDALRADRDSVRELADELPSRDGDDDDDDVVEMRAECASELASLVEAIRASERRLVRALLPRDPEDRSADCLVEVRAGTGGDEAAFFAAELSRAYERTARRRGWDCEILDAQRTGAGGVREIVLGVSAKQGSGGGGYYSADHDDDDGDDDEQLGPYGYFKYESGVHRVQRVPVNDVRVHTSAASVAVLPSSRGGDRDGDHVAPLDDADLRIDTFRASGAGGQHVNTTESAVRITHVPTGITAAIQDERSQHRNKAKALRLLTARVRDAEREAERAKSSSRRRELLGGGGRSERVRTYNFAQDRITDHRCKQSEYGVARLLDGGNSDDGGGGGESTSGGGGLVGTFGPKLRALYVEELLRELEEEGEEAER